MGAHVVDEFAGFSDVADRVLERVAGETDDPWILGKHIEKPLEVEVLDLSQPKNPGAGLINKILTVKELFDEFMMEFEKSRSRICAQ